MSPQRDRKARRAARQAGPTKDRSTARRRLGLLIFGVLFVVLFLGFAIAQGIGDPDIPSDAIIVVQDAPSDDTVVEDCNGKKAERDPGTITKEEFDCALQQTAAQGGLDPVPKPGDKQYDALKSAAIGDLLDMVWIEGEAEDRGITVSKHDVDVQFEQIVSQNFPSCKEGQDPFDCKQLQQFLDSSHFSEDDVRQRVELQLLSTELQKQVTENAPTVTQQQVEDFYEAAKDEGQFTTPTARDFRLVLNRDKAKVEEAKAELEKDDSGANWSEIAKRLSTDAASKNNGGERKNVSEGLVEEPLNTALFEATVGQLEGPIKTPLGYYVFEVTRIRPEAVQPLKSVEANIKEQLTQTAQQDAFGGFVEDYGSKWQSRTFCDSDYSVERCSNFAGSGHPPNSPPTCYEEHPKGGRPDACPAPVIQAVPALPGTVSLVTPKGVPLPQRPQPEGLKPAQAAGLPGASGGVPVTPPPAP